MHRTFFVLVGFIAILGSLGLVPSSASALATDKECALPAAGRPFETADPSEVALKDAQLQAATAFAASRNRTSVLIFRNNCLVSKNALNALTGNLPWDLWSSTKSVVSLAAGVAIDQGKLDLDAPIGTYLPQGEGDSAHRAITVRNLLQENSGLKQSIITEAGTVALDVNLVKQALALPLDHEPGTFFEYGQRNPDLLAYVIEQAVGQDFQQFVQDSIFTPIGIPRSGYIWLRDRSGNTYGHAHLLMKPNDFARIGLLLENEGSWNGRQVVSSAYLATATTSSKTNSCYGMLFWVNKAPCIGPSIPSRKTYSKGFAPGFPSSLYATVGFLQQNNFVLTQYKTVVSWTGIAGDLSLDPETLISASPSSELYYNFFRKLGPAYEDVKIEDPGPFKTEFNFTVDPGQFADPRIALGALGIGPFAPAGCTLLACDGTIPLVGLTQNGLSILRVLGLPV